jgi:hypothetical protein
MFDPRLAFQQEWNHALLKRTIIFRDEPSFRSGKKGSQVVCLSPWVVRVNYQYLLCFVWFYSCHVYHCHCLCMYFQALDYLHWEGDIEVPMLWNMMTQHGGFIDEISVPLNSLLYSMCFWYICRIYIYMFKVQPPFSKRTCRLVSCIFPMENPLTSGISFFFFLGGYKQLQQFKHQSLSRPRLPFRSALRSETIVRFTLPQSNAILRVGTGSWERRNMYT